MCRRNPSSPLSAVQLLLRSITLLVLILVLSEPLVLSPHGIASGSSPPSATTSALLVRRFIGQSMRVLGAHAKVMLWLRMQDQSLADTSQSALTATGHSITWTNDRCDSSSAAVRLAGGTGNYISIPGTIFKGLTEFTISLWHKSMLSKSDGETLLSLWDSAASAGSGAAVFKVEMLPTQSNKMRITMYDDISFTDASTFVQGNWNHITVRWSTSLLTVSINGEQKYAGSGWDGGAGNVGFPGSGSFDGAGDFVIGQQQGNSGPTDFSALTATNGVIKDVRMFAEALDSKQIDRLGRPPPCVHKITDRPLVHYRLNLLNILTSTPVDTANTGEAPRSGTSQNVAAVSVSDMCWDQAYSFAGTTTSYTSLDAGPVVSGLQDLTVSFWFSESVSRTGRDLCCLTSWAASLSGGDETNEFLFLVPTTTLSGIGSNYDSVKLNVGGDPLFNHEGGQILPPGKPHFVTITRKDLTWKVYVDGVQKLGKDVELIAHMSPIGNIPTNGLILGQDQDSVGGTFSASQLLKGEMSDFQVWSRALTGDEISTMMYQRSCKQLLHWWPLKGTSLVDQGTDPVDLSTASSVVGADDNCNDGKSAAATGFAGTTGSSIRGDGFNTFKERISDFTLGMWIRISNGQVAADGSHIFSLSSQTAGNGDTLKLVVKMVSTDPELQLTLNGESSPCISYGPVPLDSWAHVLVKRIGASSNIFINGVNKGASSSCPAAACGAIFSGGFVLGQDLGADKTDAGFVASASFKGLLRDVRFYNWAFSTNYETLRWGQVPWCGAVHNRVFDYAFNQVAIWDQSGYFSPAKDPGTLHGTVVLSSTDADTLCNPRGSLSFAGGVTDWVSISKGAAAVSALDDFTFSMWMKFVQNGKSPFLLSIAWSAQFKDLSIQLVPASTKKKLNVWLVGKMVLESTADLTATQSYHIALVREARSLKLYIDGSLDTTVDLGVQFPIGPLQSASEMIIIGQGQGLVGGGFTTNQAFEGVISTVRMWNRAFSLDEVATDKRNCGGMVGWWRLAELDGEGPTADNTVVPSTSSALTDLSPGQLGNLTTSNVKFGQDNCGRAGQSIVFAGASSNKLQLQDATHFSGLMDFTVSFWMYLSGMDSGVVSLSSAVDAKALLIEMSGGGRIKVAINGVDGTETPNFLSTSTWHHIIVTRDTGGKVQIWGDGVRYSMTQGTMSGDGQKPLRKIPANGFIIGSEQVTAGSGTADAKFYDGRLRDIRIYSYSVFTATGGIKALHHRPTQCPKFSSPIVRYRLNHDDMSDSSGNQGFDGTKGVGITAGTQMAQCPIGTAMTWPDPSGATTAARLNGPTSAGEALGGVNDFTISFWARDDKTTTAGRTSCMVSLFSEYGDDVTTTSNDNEISFIRVADSSKMEIWIGQNQFFTPEESYSDTTDFHWAVTRKVRTITVYRDGEEILREELASQFPVGKIHGNGFILGQRQEGTTAGAALDINQAWMGKIVDFQFFDGALTSDQVLAQFWNHCRRLLAWWPMSAAENMDTTTSPSTTLDIATLDDGSLSGSGSHHLKLMGSNIVNTGSGICSLSTDKVTTFPGTITNYLNGDATFLSGVGDFTFSVWFWLDPTTSVTLDYSAFFSVHTDQGTDSGDALGIWFRDGGTATPKMTVEIMNEQYRILLTNGGFDPLAWNRLSVVREGLSVKGYINSTEVYSKTFSAAKHFGPQVPNGLVVGNEQGSVNGGFFTTHSWDGKMMDMRFYDYALPLEVIRHLSTPPHCQAGSGIDVTKQPIVHYSMLHPVASQHDLTTLGHDGTKGAAITTSSSPSVCRNGPHAIDFNRDVTSWVSGGAGNVVQGLQDFTISFWVHLKNSSAGQAHGAVSMASSTTPRSMLIMFENPGWDTHSYPRLRILDDNDLCGYRLKVWLKKNQKLDAVWAMNTNHHYVFTRKGMNVSIWGDGVLKVSALCPQSPPVGPIESNGLFFGADQTSLAGGFQITSMLVGKMSDMRVYNHVLSPDAISQLYYQNCAVMLAHWALRGQETTDSTGNGWSLIATNPSLFPDSGTVSRDQCGQLGMAFMFPDTKGTSYSVHADGSMWSGLGDFTVSLWIFMNSDSGDATFCSVKTAAGELSLGVGTGKFKGTYFGTTISTSTSFDNSVWHHIAFARKGSTIELHVNGTLDGSSASASSAGFDVVATNAFYIGQLQQGSVGTAGFTTNTALGARARISDYRVYGRHVGTENLKRLGATKLCVSPQQLDSSLRIRHRLLSTLGVPDSANSGQTWGAGNVGSGVSVTSAFADRLCKQDSAHNFDKTTTAYDQFDTNAMLQGATDFTLSFWAFVEDWGSEEKAGPTVFSAILNDNKEELAVGFAPAPGSGDTSGPGTLWVDLMEQRWHLLTNTSILNVSISTKNHFAIVRTSTYLTVYIDGVLAGTSPKMFENFPLGQTHSSGLFSGNRQDGTSQGTSGFSTASAYKGLLADIRFYGRTLSVEEIGELTQLRCQSSVTISLPTREALPTATLEDTLTRTISPSRSVTTSPASTESVTTSPASTESLSPSNTATSPATISPGATPSATDPSATRTDPSSTPTFSDTVTPSQEATPSADITPTRKTPTDSASPTISAPSSSSTASVSKQSASVSFTASDSPVPTATSTCTEVASATKGGTPTATPTRGPTPSISQSTTLHGSWLIVGNSTKSVRVADLLSATSAAPKLVIVIGGGEKLDISSFAIATTDHRNTQQLRRFDKQQQQSNGSTATIQSGVDVSQCVKVTANHPFVTAYIEGNVTASTHNDTAMVITFGKLSGNETEISKIPSDQVASVTVLTECLKQRKPTTPVNFTFIKPPVVIVEQTATAEAAADAKGAVSQLGAIPGVAVAGARSGLLLTLAKCEPDFYEEIGSSQNPSRLSIGDPKYGQFVAIAIFNHIIILGVALGHFLFAVMYAFFFKVTIGQGTSRARCPSLTIIPVLAFLEPTCMGAVVTIIYGDSAGLKIVGILSLMLCYVYVVGLFVYLKKTWAGVFIKGENPGLFIKAKKRIAITDDDDPLRNEARPKTFGRRLLAWLGYFVDGNVSWKDSDPENNKGYCRRNRLLFMDFIGEWYWFLAVELLVCALCGTLDGIKLGVSQCNGIIVALIVILLGYLAFIAKTKPYNAPFLMLFSLALTVIQLVAAIFMAVSMFGGGDSWQERAEVLTVIAFYTIIFRAFFDIAPKVKQMINQVIKSLCGKKKQKKSNNLDLTEQLLVAVRQDENVENQVNAAPTDVNAAQNEEMEMMLPEFEVEEEEEYEELDLDNPTYHDLSGDYRDVDPNTAPVLIGLGGSRGTAPPTAAERQHRAEMFKILADMEEHDNALAAEKEREERSAFELQDMPDISGERAEAIKTEYVAQLGKMKSANAAHADRVQEQEREINPWMKPSKKSTFFGSGADDDEDDEEEGEPPQNKRQGGFPLLAVPAKKPQHGEDTPMPPLLPPPRALTTGDPDIDNLLDELDDMKPGPFPTTSAQEDQDGASGNDSRRKKLQDSFALKLGGGLPLIRRGPPPPPPPPSPLPKDKEIAKVLQDLDAISETEPVKAEPQEEEDASPVVPLAQEESRCSKKQESSVEEEVPSVCTANPDDDEHAAARLALL